MKLKIITISFILSTAILLISCGEEFLYRAPQGSIDQESLANEQGIELLVTGAYACLTTPNWGAGPFNWIYGSIYGGDANKGSSPSDQPAINDFETYNALPSNSYLTQKFSWVYRGVRHANTTLQTIAMAKNTPEEFLKNKSGEAYFLRAYFYFEGIKVFGPYLPWLDETMEDPDPKVYNDIDIYTKVLADADKAIQNLKDIQDSPGRTNSWAAKALKAKILMQQGNFTAAKPILKDVIDNGHTAKGVKYGLEDDMNANWDSFRENGKEAIFSVQYSYERNNANFEMALAHPSGSGPGGCCGFFQPSNELANSYKVDANGLPFLDNSYRNAPYVTERNPIGEPYISINNDMPVDPRIDFAIGRFGIPYKDWGIPEVSWARNIENGGFFMPKKHVFSKAEKDANLAGDINEDVGTGSSMNVQILNLRDIILLYAESLAYDGELSEAMEMVNKIRERAGKKDNIIRLENGEPAANYSISTYPTSHVAYSNKEECIKAVRMERKLELAMEGQRWFDLVRYGGDYMSAAISEYINFEKTFINKFTMAANLPATNTIFPIPEGEIQTIGVDENGKPYLEQNDPWR
ncbi:RagB/SusD family nutrient uptake outer membrane protein [Limibacterium fermenti]|uniref:RagB/SusD family nutrient uptake outer membrane protein n=1 Tax=Limibacterium fermenti TaxID=3229863 RepID=UPI003A738503